MTKKQIKLYFADFDPSFKYDDNWYCRFLQKHFDVVLDSHHPDFLIYSCFGKKHMEYDCVKIFYSYENVSPDFNVADYAIDFDYIDFEDRYIRHVPDCSFVETKEFQARTIDDYKDIANKKSKFCNFIYSNNHCSDSIREVFFRKLSHYKHVDSGGKFLNNIGAPVDDKIAWQRDYKFSIACENSSKNGYTTEKMYDALKADTIPIYWGNKRVSDEFNPKRFINCHDYKNFDEVIEQVQYLDHHPDAYLEMLSQPWFVLSTQEIKRLQQHYEDWFLHIFTQTPQDARRTTHYGWVMETSQSYIPRNIRKMVLENQGCIRDGVKITNSKKKKTVKQRIGYAFGLRLK